MIEKGLYMGFFEKFKEGLNKTRDFLQSGFVKLTAQLGYFDVETLDELEELLILSDLGMPTVQKIMDNIKENIKQEGLGSKEAIVAEMKKIILPILEKTENKKLVLEKDSLNVLLMVGVNGTGKTTTTGKLAHRFKKEGKKVLLAGADTFRAAAIEQLETWAQRVGVDFISKTQGADPASVVYEALDKAKQQKYDVLIVDTAGRLHNKQNLMAELEKIHRIIAKQEQKVKVQSLLVLDATTGQNAVLQAKYFHEVCALDGLVLTKLDGNSKGGVAVAVCAETSLPIFLAGLGEKMEDLVDFSSEDFVASLLPETKPETKEIE